MGIAAAAVVTLAVGTAAGSVVLEKYAVGVHDNPLRLFGLIQANFQPGCAPAVNPIACHVAGRAWRLQSSGAPWSARADGENGYRFEIRSGDQWAKDAFPGHPVERTELSDLDRMPYGKDIWLAFTMEVEPGPPSTADWINLGQLHGTADPGERAVSPPWVQRLLRDDRFRVEVRHTLENPVKASPPPTVIFEDPKLERGRPYRFVYHFRISPGPDGMARLWRDGKLVADYRGPIGYPDKRGPYFKFGVYRAPAPGGERVAARYSDVTLGPTPPGDRLPAAPVS
ncbi:MAG: putative hemolysin-adenlyate cyclase protein [Phenylobacterium sp.]|nr:putative hemolysin-adenlyate cyclase protein [Phenylobacterium sp.]